MLLSLRPQQQTNGAWPALSLFFFGWLVASFAGMGWPGVHICKENHIARTKGVFGNSWRAAGMPLVTRLASRLMCPLVLYIFRVCVLLTWSCQTPFGLNLDSLWSFSTLFLFFFSCLPFIFSSLWRQKTNRVLKLSGEILSKCLD